MSSQSTVVGSAPLLEVRDVIQRFGGITAVDGASITVRAGTVHGLIGPNGAGKTTFFDCIAGIRRPVGGTILLDGHDVTNESSVRRARRGLRRTFQRQQVFGWLSVEDNVLLAVEWHGGGGGMIGDLLGLPSRRRRERERRERVEAVLERCGLLRLRNELAGGLSIGELRRVELARAIVDSPRLLLLDEPTSGLEDHEIEELGEILDQLAGTDDCGVLLIEHHIPFVMRHSAEVSVLELGRLIAHGTPEEIMRNEAVQDAYLS
ncbi:branched-chain amino acid transport system ATP-binding protein [Parafrankia irregularis]|uniref:Branched-chain amino acid transport system ATP-binding protein n=1 Tax=Parafrankia irregularis TaxID=795642 RepID=A0A0S4QMS6_9ACTN|nr:MULTISPECIES: ATP-binding cassette domain-containing protein [Parafrankia]CUU56660.1 branched-chain amino acid transport system ATP-binding protein [Parafrankia irregularis]